MTDRERGAATVLALFATVTMVLLGASVWVIALSSIRDAHAAHGGTVARGVAEAALARIASTLSPQALTMGLGQSRPLGTASPTSGVIARMTVERVGRELFVVTATGRDRRSGSSLDLGYGVWSLEPGARLAAAPGVVTTAGILTVGGGGRVVGTGANQPPHPSWASVCASWTSAADSLIPGGRMTPWAVDTSAAVQLGHLDQAALHGFASHVVSGVVTPAPSSSPLGCSTTASMNWGDPTGGGCGSYRPIIAASGDLTIVGGVGQGVLLVPGSLTLTSGARYFGVVLVGGSIRVTAGAAVHGLVRAGGGVSVQGATIQASSCSVLEALRRSDLRTPLPMPNAWLDPI